MSTHIGSDATKTRAGTGSGIRATAPYQKPAFRHERVFETMALSCGKIAATQEACAASRKVS